MQTLNFSQKDLVKMLRLWLNQNNPRPKFFYVRIDKTIRFTDNQAIFRRSRIQFHFVDKQKLHNP